MKKIRVGVIFGGRSGEHEVSLRSAESVLHALDRNKYDVVPIGITHEGRWLASKNALALLPPKDAIEKTFTTGEPVTLPAEPVAAGMVDVIFPVLHGTFGEDGTIQGLLELANVPYVGAGVLGSAVGMDKDVMKRLLRDADLPIGEYWTLRRTEIARFVKEKAGQLSYPVFVKPANLGSSVGITKVHDAEELENALNAAGEYDRKIVVERGIDAREIEVSVLGNDDPIASVPGEIVPSREFYDYQAKYIDDNSELIIPANLSNPQVTEVQNLAISAFKVLECSGMARVDLFLERSTENFLINEINTLPGFTSISMYPKLWEASGIPYPELIDRLIALAIERHAEKNKLRTRY
ncbi:MAG: D-alanine--D-alanine ligase [Acidobacteria bacterium]|nr:D-alanine--D-alanine ligase [Acidobacteriota bacterium]